MNPIPPRRYSLPGLVVIVLSLTVQSVGAQVLPSWWNSETIQQPTNTPLWQGLPYGNSWYKYNDAVIATGTNKLHAIGITGQGLTTAVVDTGFYVDHEIFNGKIINHYTGGEDVHGTLVSGIVLSMAPGSHLWLGTYAGAGLDSFQAIAADAATFNIVAVNNSWGDPIEGLYTNPSDVAAANSVSNAAIQDLLDQGIIVVAASGNGSINDRMGFLDGLPGVLAVGSLNQYGYITDFTSLHDKGNLFLAAPGDMILSALDGTDSYGLSSGTSMASPHVTGAVTLLLSGAREASPQEIIEALYDAADRIPYNGNAVVLREHMPTGNDPTVTKTTLEGLSGVADISEYTDWLAAIETKYNADEMTADDWRTLGYIDTLAKNVEDDSGSRADFVNLVNDTGGLTTLQFSDYRFLRVDKAYMLLTHRRMENISSTVDTVSTELGGMFHAYARELGSGLQYDSSQIFQRLDYWKDNKNVLTGVARQMSPRLTNALAESTHLGFVGLHRSLGRRAELNRLSQFSGSTYLGQWSDCDPCEPVCSSYTGKISGWIEGFGAGFNKSGTLTNAGYRGHFAETAFGYEHKVGNRTLGFFGGIADQRVRGDGLADGHWANLGVYGRVDRRNFFLEGSLSYGYGDYDLTRYVYIPGAVYDGVDGPIVYGAMTHNAFAMTRAHDLAMRVATGSNWRKTNGWIVGPRGEMSLSHLAIEGYREFGAGSLNLAVDGYTTTYLEGGLGLFVGKQFRNFSATGKVMGMYGGVSGDDLSGRFMSFGSPYRVSAGHLSNAWVTPEATLAWTVSRGMSISGSYAGRFGEKYHENAGSVSLNLYW